MELHEEENEVVHERALPTRIYYLCPQCLNTFAVYSRKEEGES